MNIAYEKAQNLKKLIDDLFEYTRINNGLPLDIREIDMAQFMRQLIEEFVPSLEKAGMECKLAAEEGLVIRADGAQLVRAYENLISNAIRYGESGHRIDIAVRSVGGQVSISFTNYGDPIPERDLPFIFDRFYRVEASRSKQTGAQDWDWRSRRVSWRSRAAKSGFGATGSGRPLKPAFPKSYSSS